MSSSPLFPPYRQRYLPAMTLREIAALPDKASAPVIIATGAIEQHGPHLPVAVDSFLGQVWVNLVTQRLPAGTPCYIAPPITIGKSNEHVGYPGTLIISRDLLRLQLLSIARQLHAWGFGTLAILNTHGGNTSVLTYTLREIRAELGMRANFLRPTWSINVSAQEGTYGFHANQFESAVMLALAGKYTQPAAAVCHYPAFIDEPGELRPEGSPATFSWASQDLSPSGIMGDAPAATLAQGVEWTEKVADAFTAEVVRWATDPTRGASPDLL